MAIRIDHSSGPAFLSGFDPGPFQLARGLDVVQTQTEGATMQVPADFTTGLLIEPASDGQIAVGFAKDGTLMGDFTLSPLDVANMAAALLGASKDVSNQLPEREDQTDNSGALVAPSSISLGPGRIPGEHALIFSFGESHLALPLDPGAMKSLGETMVTLSATGRVQ